MNLELIPLLLCPECRESQFDIERYDNQDGRILNGRLICRSCKLWYRIQNGIVDMLPTSLRDESKYRQFAETYHIEYQKLQGGKRNRGNSTK
jgi:uncharacterized protein YbaR (Trm112 family)